MMKKTIAISLLLPMFCVLGLMLAGCQNNASVGTVSGAEHEYLTVGDRAYVLCADAPYHASDRDNKIGKIRSGDMTFTVYSVKGTDQYVYCRWEWEGRMYRLVQD